MKFFLSPAKLWHARKTKGPFTQSAFHQNSTFYTEADQRENHEKEEKKTELENESVKCQQASMLLYMDFLFLMLGFFQSHFPAGIRDEKTVF